MDFGLSAASEMIEHMEYCIHAPSVPSPACSIDICKRCWEASNFWLAVLLKQVYALFQFLRNSKVYLKITIKLQYFYCDFIMILMKPGGGGEAKLAIQKNVVYTFEP